MMEQNDHIVAVYGTLRKGCNNNVLLSTSEYLGNHVVESPLTLYVSSWLPMVAPGESTSRLVYDLYRVNDVTLRNLDTLEGHPEWYVRSKFRFQDYAVDKDKALEAWIYLMPKDYIEERGGRAASRKVDHGDYIRLCKTGELKL